VRLKLYKGNTIIAGRTSPHSLYDESLASFGASDYDHADAAGFIRLFSLPTRVEAAREHGTAEEEAVELPQTVTA
jgi:argininosuccinate synthase